MLARFSVLSACVLPVPGGVVVQPASARAPVASMALEPVMN
jgi:hypothetical protein